MATEMGKPMLINDEDCDTEYPHPFDEENAISSDPLNAHQPSILLATLHIARLLSPLAKLTRSLCINTETLNRFESYLASCMHLFPQQLQLASNTPLDPLTITPLICFQNARLLLHRHNLSPSCSLDQRYQSISHCVIAAQDTAKIIDRCTGSPDWKQRFLTGATTFLCTHLWRCMLFLIFRRSFEPFFVILRASTLLDDSRAVNISCGRYLSFFVRRLIDRLEQERYADLEQDEEILVYLSADIQASPNSWAWGNAETGTLLSRRQKHGRPRNTTVDSEQYEPPDRKMAWRSQLSEEEQSDWGGWERVERAVQYLQHLQESIPLPRPPSQPPAPPITRSPESDDSQRSSGPSQGTASASDSTRSRMTIASII